MGSPEKRLRKILTTLATSPWTCILGARTWNADKGTYVPKGADPEFENRKLTGKKRILMRY